MEVIRGLKNLKGPIKRSVLTIGVFDGIHIGHKEIIKRVTSAARASRSKSVVVTFDPHPLKILRPGHKIPSLISLNHRIRLIKDLGIDYLLILKFTKALARLSAQDFVKNILVHRLGMKAIYVSENFYFGRGGMAGAAELKKMGKTFSFGVKVLRPVRINGKVVSSTLIRDLIIRGDISTAAKLLGRLITILGTVVRGTKLARALGYPTANINPHHEVIPPSGVWAVKVRFNKRILDGILNIGVRPTFYSSRDLEPTIELHIFDFAEKIYGRDIEVIFVKKLRAERRFKNAAALIAQIKEDERLARAILQRR